MAQYSGSSLADLGSPVEAFPTAEAEDRLSSIVGQIHEHQVPAHAIDALDRLYGSLYASYRFLSLGDASATTHAWTGYRRSEIVGVLLFRVEGERIRVLTEMFALDKAVAATFCRDVFDRYEDVREIDFNAISLPSGVPRLTCQYFPFSENYVLSLPASVDQYLKALGKSTRKTLRGYGNRLLREHPDFEWRCYPPGALPRHAQRALVRQLQEFKRASMAERGKQAQTDARETAQLLLMAADCGWYSMGTLDGRLCAGSLALRVGDDYVMMLCAADPALSEYRLGLLACYWSLCDCIRQGARQCHLLWGRYRYKEQLLAVPVCLHRLRVYRCAWQILCRPASSLSMAAMGLLYRCRFWLLKDSTEQRGRAWLGLSGLTRRWMHIRQRNSHKK